MKSIKFRPSRKWRQISDTSSHVSGLPENPCLGWVGETTFQLKSTYTFNIKETHILRQIMSLKIF